MSFIGITHYKKTSERLPGKHHKDFYNGYTLVDIKLQQLFKSGAEHVYVSTDDPDVENTDNVTFIQRDSNYCNNVTRFGYVLERIYNDVPIDDNETVVYTLTCCPLFHRYNEMFEVYNRTGNNQIAVHPSTHYYLDVNKRPINFNFGLWMTYSQGIDPVYLFPYAGTMCKMADLREAKYCIPLEFDYFNLSQFEAIDIDTQEEFETARILFNERK